MTALSARRRSSPIQAAQRKSQTSAQIFWPRPIPRGRRNDVTRHIASSPAKKKKLQRKKSPSISGTNIRTNHINTYLHNTYSYYNIYVCVHLSFIYTTSYTYVYRFIYINNCKCSTYRVYQYKCVYIYMRVRIHIHGSQLIAMFQSPGEITIHRSQL